MSQYIGLSNEDLLSYVINDLVEKNNLTNKRLGDVILGTVMNHPMDWSLARQVVLNSKLSRETPGLNIQRACGTGLEACHLVVLKIASGQIDVGIAGGSDTNSDIPFLGQRKLTHWFLNYKKAKSIKEKMNLMAQFSPKFLVPEIPVVKEPKTGLSMGEHCELMVKEWGISQKEQDELALASHQNALKAYDEGFHNQFIVSVNGLKKDTNLRADSSLEKLAKLQPAFDRSPLGTITAGNSTPLTDGASAVLLSSDDWAKKNGLEIDAYLLDVEVAAIDFIQGEGLLMAPTLAVSRLLERNKMSLQDFDFYEIHEAFAGQVLCNLKAFESKDFSQRVLNRKDALGSIDRTKLNVKGGSIALGHPFAATGGRMLGTASKLLKKRGLGRVLVSICTAGGMGIAAIVERAEYL